MSKVDIKKEFRKLKKHREKYFPVVKYLLELHLQKDDFTFPIEISETSDILIILELIDLEYLDRNSFIIKKDFIEITGLLYRGNYPLTKTGELVFTHSPEIESDYKKNITYGFVAILFIIIFLKFII